MRSFSGQLVKTRLEELGRRPEHLALAINRSTSTVQYYLRGVVVPPLPVAAAIADELGCTLDDLLVNDDAAAVEHVA